MALVRIKLAYRAHPFRIFMTHMIAFIDHGESHVQSKLYIVDIREGNHDNENND